MITLPEAFEQEMKQLLGAAASAAPRPPPDEAAH